MQAVSEVKGQGNGRETGWLEKKGRRVFMETYGVGRRWNERKEKARFKSTWKSCLRSTVQPWLPLLCHSSVLCVAETSHALEWQRTGSLNPGKPKGAT